jgi:23S rRNA (adenine-C8)-methyltransferase
MYSIHDEDKLKEFLSENKISTFRYNQIENAIYKNYVTDFNKIETIPKDLREKLVQNFFYTTLEVDTQKTSEN